MLRKAPAFYVHLRAGLLGPQIETSEVTGCEAILKAMEGLPTSHVAYAFATAYHETNATLLPVVEAYWLSEAWRKKNLRYYPWHGRGLVQVTWEENYRKADRALKLNGTLLANPDRALEPAIAADIMRIGMVEGWFAGDKNGRHTLARHLPAAVATLEQFKAARRIINGVDDDLLIARHAIQFQTALLLGGWE